MALVGITIYQNQGMDEPKASVAKNIEEALQIGFKAPALTLSDLNDKTYSTIIGAEAQNLLLGLTSTQWIYLSSFLVGICVDFFLSKRVIVQREIGMALWEQPCLMILRGYMLKDGLFCNAMVSLFPPDELRGT